jgi:energy-coupling factor transport system ATP-binding protein
MIDAHNLVFRYPPLEPHGEGLLVLDGLATHIGAGERVALLGATGAGKTTLALVLAGLAPALTGGELHGDLAVAGHDVRATDATVISEKVGLVFQEADHQLFNMTVEDEVAFGLEGLALPPEEIERRAGRVLEQVGLGGLRDRAPWQLSGGQQKRLALASILVMRPQVLVLDEPMAGLDPLGRRAIALLLDELKEQAHTTILVIEQDTEWVARWASRVLVLHEGKIVLDGPARAVLSAVEELSALGVQPPQMAEVAMRLGLPGQPLTSTEAAPRAREWLKSTSNTPATRRAVATRAAQDSIQPEARHDLAASAEALWFRYPEGPQALAGLTLDIPRGQFVMVAGPNGGGKTTLAKHLNGLLRPDRGQVLLFGQATRGHSTGELARQAGYVFQNPDLQIFAATVRAELSFGLHNLGLSTREVEERVERALDRFDLQRWKDTPPAVLGYGQRRMVTLAAVWAMQPPLWILDEPTTGLDARLTARLVSEMRSLHHAGHTLLLVSHDLRLAAIAERLVVIAGGRVVLDGEPRAVLADADALQPFGLRPPPVARLATKVLHPARVPLTVAGLLDALETAHDL